MLKRIFNISGYLFADVKYLLVLLLCCLLAYWPLTFHLYSLKNDALVVFLPIRYQISEAINQGVWPLWTPYLNLGYPLHADMQAGVWNPFVYLFSLCGPYTLARLQNETLLYIFLSGVTMFYLLKHFSLNKAICLFGATAYMLCGYISDSAQFLLWIASAAFLPAVILFYYRLIQNKSYKDALWLSFFLFLLFTCGYPADFILTGYLLIAFLLFYLFQNKKQLHRIEVVELMQLHLLTGICFTILSLPAILSYIQVLPLVERGSGLSYSDAMSNPLHPLLLFSYVTPLAVWKAPYVAITDPLERNCFIGFITFIILISGLFLKTENKIARFGKWAILVSLIFSLGEIGGLRPLTYYVLPLMNTFRHPANAKLFTVFFACILSAFTIHNLSVRGIPIKYRFFAWLITGLLLIALAIWALTGSSTLLESIGRTPVFNQGAGKLKILLDSMTFSDFLYINILLQLPFFIIAYFFFVKKPTTNWLIFFGIINSLIHTALFQPFTVVKKDSVQKIQSILDQLQEPGYPPPDLAASLYENSKDGYQYFKEIAAANMYNKKIGRTDFHIIPSNLHEQSKFWKNEKLKSLLIHYPFFYRADTAFDYSTSLTSTNTNKKIALTNNTDLKNFINASNVNTYSAETKFFDPNRLDIKIKSSHSGFYTLFQNFYPRWEVFIDNKKANLERCNISFMGVRVSAGEHLVSFRYKADDIKIAFYLSLSLLVIFLIIALSQLINTLKLISFS